MMKLNLQCYVINLDRSPKRLKQMKARLANMPFEWLRISVIDGNLLPQLLITEVDELQYERCHGKPPIARAEVGCYLSHIRALQVFLQSSNTATANRPFVWYKILSTYVFRIRNELRRFKWAWGQK